MAQVRTPCLLIRGGTSKGAYFSASDLPSDPQLRDRFLLAAMGSPDTRQIDGIGGADSLTSKVAIIRPSQRDDADVDYLFAQVVVDQARVDYGQNCGNILAGVGPFALERGLIPTTGAQTAIRIFMENTGQIAVARVQTSPDGVVYEGQTRIDGVPGTAAPIVIEFEDVAGSSCGALLPTGNTQDLIDGVMVTCIDNGMPVVLVKASDLGSTGLEAPAELDANTQLKACLESIRLQAGPLMNLGDVSERNVPKMVLISAPGQGGAISTRSFIPHRCHASIGVFGAVSVASACLLPGSVAEPLAVVTDDILQRVSVEHPSGEFTVQIRREGEGLACGLVRTARVLFDGDVLTPAVR